MAVGGALGLAVMGSASGSVVTVSSTVASDAGQVPHIKAAFTAAIEADRAMAAPDGASAYGKRANAAFNAGHIAAAADAGTRQQQLSNGLSTLAKYFTPGQAKHEAVGLQNAVNNEASAGFRNIGAGTSKIEFTQVAVSGDTATVQAAVTTWAKFQQQQPDGKWVTAGPVNVMDYTATLVQSASGQWVISSLQGDFAPGEGP